MSGWSLDYDDDITLAAEYVLGLLSPAELALIEERLAVDPAFRELVDRWEHDLASMTDDIPEIQPPRGLEGTIRRRLFGDEAPPRRRWTLWPALLGGLVAAGLALWVIDPGLLGQAEPDYAARIAAEDGSLVVEARFDLDSRQLSVERVSGEMPEGRDLELWLVHMPESTTTSLGVLPRDPSGVIEVSADMARQFEDNLLALSVEPIGGSPTGQATGPVVAVGPITGL
jgi:anti-sigma-K factor RskA